MPVKKRSKKVKPSSKEWQNIKGTKRDVLISLRNKKGFTQGQLANLVGVSPSYIANLESGRIKPGLEVSLKLEEILKAPFETLFPDL